MGGRCQIRKSKEAATVIVWYGVVMFTSMTLQSLSWTNTDEIKRWVTSITVIILYTSFGLVADVFIGRYRSVTFGLWGLWTATLIVTFFFSFIAGDYSFPEWFGAILAVGSIVIIYIGPSAFQVTALQFGTDQLQDCPSEDLSTFIFWYFWMEMLVETVLGLSVDYAYSCAETTIVYHYIQLGCLMLSALLLSLILATKSCFMSNWFLRDPCALTISSKKLKRSLENPYSLIYHVLNYAKNHEHPVGRSALTYWENKIPSRIDLDKHKYGGPFTVDEVENVKTFFRLVKLLGSLVGVFVALISIEIDLWFALVPHFSDGDSNVTQVNLIQLLCGIVIVIFLLPLYKLFISPHFQKYIPNMLKRIWIGAMLATMCAGSILLIDAIGHSVNDTPVPCFLSDSAADVKLKLNPYLVLIPFTLYNVSYIIFTISLFEFIIAQSLHPMKGLLVGLYYSIRFGIGGCFTTINHYAFNFSTSRHLMSCGTANYIMITAVSLLSLVLFTIVARQYRLRERDEVVNIHLFAEEYYTK